ncbi:winged helix-turn-helix transcriptional regulator [Paenibacillus sedimenti]|uniref:Winged helix-turn-helix transcriptional regulator n=1 Tax=Paenibacillus sedimenti TaxID=2770274 RepID=A0A926QMD2_9BACL|nr:winged helix-turn-helix transcriptional regulator [Paenibacillus sedimenti]MBD0383803.1 winged helix-turn-helix transcriptional regulator [Paenibacillus sedimenti]
MDQCQSQSQMCPRFEKAVEILSKRWTSLIVFQLLSGPQRFVQIDHALPNLSGKVLSERLKELEQEGIVKRVVFPESPVRIEYSLTDKGRALAPIFVEIGKWSSEWLPVPE